MFLDYRIYRLENRISERHFWINAQKVDPEDKDRVSYMKVQNNKLLTMVDRLDKLRAKRFERRLKQERKRSAGQWEL